jgi:hypothetical protein
MKKLINSVLFASAVTFLPATPIKADLSIALVINETTENITLESGDYVLHVPAGQKRQPLRVAVPQGNDYACPVPSIDTENYRFSFWCEGNKLVCETYQLCGIVLENMDIQHSAGLLIRITPAGVFFRLLANFEKTAVGTICA